MRSFLAGCAAVVAAATLTPSAHAATSVWWTHSIPSGISWAATDTSAAGNLPTPGVVLPKSIQGMALDPAAGRGYYVSPNDLKLRFAKLDGSGGGEIPMPGITLAEGPHGLAVDAAAGRAYIPDAKADKIYMVKLDGSGGGPINTTGVTVDSPWAVAVDPVGGRVYWGSRTAQNPGKLQYARLDGSGAGEIATTGATPPGAIYGIAIDAAANRVYWSSVDFATARISFANIDGGGGADLNTAGATATSPRGLALDTVAGRIYWANLAGATSTIGYARLDNTGGANLPTLTATVGAPWGVNVFSPPVNTAAPTVTGTGTLTCSDGTWAADTPAAFLARAPQTLAYAWSRDGQAVTGATTKTLPVSQAGAYTCTVTATNAAGSTQQVSAPVAVTGVTPPAGRPGNTTPPQPSRPSIRIVQITQKRVIRVTTSVPGTVTITAGDKARKLSRTLAAGSVSLHFGLTKKGRTTLQRNRRLSIIFTAKLVPSGGGKAVVTQKSVLLKLSGG